MDALLWKRELKTPTSRTRHADRERGSRHLLGPRRPLTAVGPRRGAAFTLETVWTNPTSRATSTPVLEGGRLYGLSHKKKGQWFCVDAAAEDALADGRRQAENAAILAGAGVLFLLTPTAR